MSDSIPYEVPIVPRRSQNGLLVLAILHYIFAGLIFTLLLATLYLYSLQSVSDVEMISIAGLFGVLVAVSGACIQLHRLRWLSVVVAILICTIVPVGTILGVATIIVIYRSAPVYQAR